jgi:hypothetical protein
MLRMIGLTLVVVTGVAKVAHAENRLDRPGANGIETALHHSPNSAQGVQLQIGGGLALAPTQEDQWGSGHLDLARIEREQQGREGRRLVRSGDVDGRSDEWLNLGASSKPALAYSVNNALSLGLDYHYESSESMNFKVAEVGGLDPNFHSHNFMIEAHLEF